MNGPDKSEQPEWPIRDRAAEHDTTVVRSPRRRNVTPILIALGGLVIILLLAWLFAGNRNADQDKLTGNEMAAVEASSTDPARQCASKATYDLIKRELFRRAAQVRGSDQAAFDRLAGYAVLRVDNPVMESENKDGGWVGCSGSLSLDLPPGLAVVGGRTTLTADADYRVQQAADNSGAVVTLGNADGIVTPLATLTRTAPAAPEQPGTQLQPPPIPGPAPGTEGEVAAPNPPPPSTSEQPAPVRPVGARPSFDCGNARTRGEVAVCASAGLAALDRTMAAQYRRALDNASPEQRAVLQQTRDRFLRYRDRCSNNACIGDAYTGRMREIRDIMEDNWQPR